MKRAAKRAFAQAMKLFNPDRGWQRVDSPAPSK
jgi:hypothetical protein